MVSYFHSQYQQVGPTILCMHNISFYVTNFLRTKRFVYLFHLETMIIDSVKAVAEMFTKKGTGLFHWLYIYRKYIEFMRSELSWDVYMLSASLKQSKILPDQIVSLHLYLTAESH